MEVKCFLMYKNVMLFYLYFLGKLWFLREDDLIKGVIMLIFFVLNLLLLLNKLKYIFCFDLDLDFELYLLCVLWGDLLDDVFLLEYEYCFFDEK